MKQFHMDSLYMSLSQFLVSNGVPEMREMLLQNKKASKSWEWLLYVCISETKETRTYDLAEQRKENGNWIPILRMRKASMLIKQLPSIANKTNKGYGISPLPFQIHDYMKGNKEKCLYC